MLLFGLRRRLIATGGGGGGGSLPTGPYYTENSAIYHDPTNYFTQVFHPSYTSVGGIDGLAGTVDTTKTAVMTANAGGSGVHAFNPSGASGVRWRSNTFVAQPGSTASVFSVAMKNYTGDSGQKLALAIYCTTRPIVTSTNTSPIRVTVPKHGRLTGDSVTIAGHYNRIPTYYGVSNANGTWTVTRIDDDTLELNGSIGNGTGLYTGLLTGDNVRASIPVTLTGTMTSAQLTFSGSVPGAEYDARITNDPALGADASARAFLGTQALTCTGATGLFTDYVRLQWMPQHWQYDLEANAPYVGYWAFSSNRGKEASTHAYLETSTNATELVVETSSLMYSGYVNGGYTIAASTGIVAKLDNATYVDVKGTRDTASELISVPLPGTLTNVKLYNVGRNNIASGWVGSHYRAIYLARGKAFEILAQPAATSRVVCTVGDSITSGFAAQPMAQYAWPSQLRSLLGCDVYDDGTGGIISFAFSGASCQERANKVAQCNPTDITLALGTNDWQQENAGLQSLDNYELYMGALIDAFHTTMPSAKINIFAIWNKTSYEFGPNGYGHTIDDFRRRLLKLVYDRGSPSWLRVFWVKDWTIYSGPGDDYRAMPVGMIDELVHPNNQGMNKMAIRAAAAITATKLAVSPATATLPHTTGTQTFSASGGSGSGRVWSLAVNQSGGSINSSTGVYTAGGTAGTDVVQVMDSDTQIGFSVVTVT